MDVKTSLTSLGCPPRGPADPSVWVRTAGSWARQLGEKAFCHRQMGGGDWGGHSGLPPRSCPCTCHSERWFPPARVWESSGVMFPITSEMSDCFRLPGCRVPHSPAPHPSPRSVDGRAASSSSLQGVPPGLLLVVHPTSLSGRCKSRRVSQGVLPPWTGWEGPGLRPEAPRIEGE